MLTVVVCTRDRRHLLHECVASVLADLPATGQVLVVEHGSGLSAFSVPGREGQVQHRWAPRPGKSRQLNQGLLASTTDVVVITDDDCRITGGWLASMVEPFSDPSVGATFGSVVGLSSVRGQPQVRSPAGPAPAVTWDYANGAAMAVRRSAVIAVGGFDERLGPGTALHGEEHDLVLRLQEAGWRVHIAGGPPVRHLEWRDDGETRRNLIVYSRGAGAFLGAAMRRSPRRAARTLARRLRYQASLWRHSDVQGSWFGPATTVAFARGLGRGLMLRPRRYL